MNAYSCSQEEQSENQRDHKSFSIAKESDVQKVQGICVIVNKDSMNTWHAYILPL